MASVRSAKTVAAGAIVWDEHGRRTFVQWEWVRNRFRSCVEWLVRQEARRTELDGWLERFSVAFARRAQTVAEARKLETTLESHQTELNGLREQSEDVQLRLTEATALRNAGENALTSAQLANQVAEISEHLHPGKDCPVCQRPLPKSFSPQQSADLNKAKVEAEAARAVQESAREERLRLDTRLESAQKQLQETRTLLGAVQVDLAQADALIATLVPAGRTPETAAAAWRNEREHVAGRVVEMTASRSKLSTELVRLSAAEASAVATLQSHEHERARCKMRIEQHTADFASRRDRLPTLFRPDESRSTVATSLTKLTEALQIAERNEGEIRAANEQLAGANQELRALEETFGTTVREPRAALVERLRAVAHLVGCPDPPARDEERVTWCAEVAEIAHAETQRLRAAGAVQQQTLEGRRQSRAALVAEIGEEPHAVLQEIALRKQTSQRDLVDAQRRENDVVATDARIGRIDAVHLGLLGLKDALKANKFRAHAAAQRERSLLIEATKVLRDMTKGRFEFAPEFRILDRESNETRSAGTLSGGEQFLASLALSLGVVEIAANAGAKIESLFLDEGFDALDSGALQQAMTELRRRAHAGRMICVISHVSQVAEFVNETLIVRRGENGSIYERRNGPIDDDPDVEGLVSHLAGERSDAGHREAGGRKSIVVTAEGSN